jgi:hypothetical protein
MVCNYQSGCLVHRRRRGLSHSASGGAHSLRGCLCGANVVTKVGSPLSQEDVVIVRVNSSRRSEVKPFLRHSLHLIARRDTRNDAILPPPLHPLAGSRFALPLSSSSAFCFRHECKLSCSLLFSRQLYSSFAHDCRRSSSSNVSLI